MSNWPSVSLSDLIRLERRRVEVVPDRQYQEIGIYCFGRGIFHKQPRSGLEVGDKDLYLIKDGDLILQVTFAWEGAIALCSKGEDGLYGSTRYPTFRVYEERCFPPYLARYLSTRSGIEQIGKICPGSAGRNRVLSIKRISEVMIPLPPLTEQRQITARVEELAAKIAEARWLREKAIEDTDKFLRSVLFLDNSSKPTPMRELVQLRQPDVIVHQEENYQFAGVYCFGRGIFKSQLRTGLDFAYPRLTRLRVGDFVYPKLMAWEGAFGVVSSECEGCVVSTEFPVFKVDRTRVLPEVLDAYFRMPSVWHEISGASTGTNVRRRRLNPNDFLAYRMPLPSQKTQEHFREISSRTGELKRLQSETAAELDAMLPAILDRAFKGEL